MDETQLANFCLALICLHTVKAIFLFPRTFCELTIPFSITGKLADIFIGIADWLSIYALC